MRGECPELQVRFISLGWHGRLARPCLRHRSKMNTGGQAASATHLCQDFPNAFATGVWRGESGPPHQAHRCGRPGTGRIAVQERPSVSGYHREPIFVPTLGADGGEALRMLVAGRKIGMSVRGRLRLREAHYDPFPPAAFFSRAGIRYWVTKRSYWACTSGVTGTDPIAPPSAAGSK